MKKIALIIAVTCVLAISAYFLACTRSTTPVVSGSSAMDDRERTVNAALMSNDFGNVMANCISQGPYDELRDSPFYGLTKPYAELSPKERLYVDGWVNPDRTAGNCMITTLAFVRQFYYANNRFPENGADLLSWWLSERSILPEEFEAMPDDKQLQEAFFAVNAITGKFYTSYTASQWQPGAIYLKQLTTTDEQTPVFAKLPPSTNFKESWRVVVYGDEPGEIIIDRPYMVDYSHSRPISKQRPPLSTD